MIHAHRCVTLSPLRGRYAILKLPPDAQVPSAAAGSEFFSVTRTAEELSIVLAEDGVPAGVTASRGWCILKLHGTFAFSETGILAGIVEPLAQEKIGVFAISTYNTDYVLVSLEQLPAAIATLEKAGHRIVESGS
jgi:uncharacterized protein